MKKPNYGMQKFTAGGLAVAAILFGNNILDKSKRVYDGGRDAVLSPWDAHPFRLISWLEMLQFSANEFFHSGRSLRTIRMDCYLASAAIHNGNVVFATVQGLDEQARGNAVKSLASVEQQFSTINMNITAETVRELIDKLNNATPHQTYQWLLDQTDMIEGLAIKELRGKAFFYIPAERMKFWPMENEPFAFGRKVSERFPSTTFDANSAAFCVATTLSTAAVFHLMRVLEISLTALGKKFNVSLAHTNWAPAIEQIESRIRDIPKDGAWRSLPDYKEQQEFYAQAATHFAIFKDAWRNYTMHVRGKYTEQESSQIFENVKTFMQKLAERLSE